MTAHDPRVTLTEAETERLVSTIAAAINHQSIDAEAGRSDLGLAEEIVYVQSAATAPGGLCRAVEQIVAEHVAARLAPIRALAEEWEQQIESSYHPDCVRRPLEELRTALDAPQDAPRGPVGGEQGAEVAGGRSEGERQGGAVLRVLRDLAERADDAVRHLDDLHATRTSDMERARLTGKSQGAELIGGYIDEAIRLEGKR